MEQVKDSVANTISFAGVSAVLMDFQTPLTIILLLTGIILNVVRIRSIKQTKKED